MPALKSKKNGLKRKKSKTKLIGDVRIAKSSRFLLLRILFSQSWDSRRIRQKGLLLIPMNIHS